MLALVYAFATPVFEAPDENYHFAFIWRLADSPDLPVQDPQVITPWFQEGSQPPLYYALSAVIVRLVNPVYEAYPLATNPHAQIGVGLAKHNHNFFVHSEPESLTGFNAESWMRAFYLVRVASILLGLLTLFAVHQIARIAVPNRPNFALLVTAAVAFNPMFLFMTASVNNDNLAMALSSVAMWLILAVWTQDVKTWRIVLLGVVMALAALSKLSGLTIYVVAGALLIALLWKRRIPLGRALLVALVWATAFGVLTAWWYIRNYTLYGDLTGTSAMISIILPRKTPYTLHTMLSEMEGLRVSFLALFGWFNVIGPRWLLWAMDLFTAGTVIGGILWIIRLIQRRVFDTLIPVGLLGLHFAVTFAGLINWTRQTPGTQGRLLFPAMAAITVLFVGGLASLASVLTSPRQPKLRYARAIIVLIPILLLCVSAVISPFAVIAPAYAAPPTVAELPAGAAPAAVHFGPIELVGYRIAREAIYPGDELPITLYYRGAPDVRNLSLYLTVLEGDKVIGKIDSYPGGGNLPTSAFDPSKLYADSYRIPLSDAASGPRQFQIAFGFWNLATQERITATRADGSPLDSVILRGGTLLSRETPPPPQVAQQATFSGAIYLSGYTLQADSQIGATDKTFTVKRGEKVKLLLNWKPLSRILADYNVFVHVLDADDQTAAQADDAPLGGTFPTTSWIPDVPFVDSYTIDTAALPLGTHRIGLGFYSLVDFTRLPLNSGGDTLILQTTLRVE